jgi:hypothetical protein
MMAAKSIPFDASAEGIWNDPSGTVIAAVTREGDEWRVLLAAGDARKVIPASDQTEAMRAQFGDPPGEIERARAVQFMDGFPKKDPEGTAPPATVDSYFFSMVGKLQFPDEARGVWSMANKVCVDAGWGTFVMKFQRDADDDLVLSVGVFATEKEYVGGLGGQLTDFNRSYVMLKRVGVPIKPSVLAEMKKTENYCPESVLRQRDHAVKKIEKTIEQLEAETKAREAAGAGDPPAPSSTEAPAPSPAPEPSAPPPAPAPSAPTR